MKFLSIAFVAALLSTAAFAQTPAPAAAPAEKAPLAKHNCPKPPMPDATKKMAVADANAFVRLLETFRNCVQTFTDGQKQVADTKQKEAEALRASALEVAAVAAAAVAAANAAAQDYNTFSEQAIKIITPVEAAETKRSNPVEPSAPKPQRGY
jgi:hypothetical protein